MTTNLTDLSHHHDPLTSHDAAEQHHTSGKRATNKATCLKAVISQPGHTSAEIGEITGLGRHEAARRLADLRNDGLVRQEGRRKCLVCRNSSVLWYPKAEKQGVLF